jgi:hypothetical protein
MHYYKIEFLTGNLKGLEATIQLPDGYLPGQEVFLANVTAKILRKLR